MHSVFLNHLGTYMVVFSIPKLLHPNKKDQVSYQRLFGRSHSRSYTRTHARTHTHTRTHAHTYIYTSTDVRENGVIEGFGFDMHLNRWVNFTITLPVPTDPAIVRELAQQHRVSSSIRSGDTSRHA